mmetsp:Transcript_62770/g.168385  ORF Transcript_62770/g.168385 Transcript_62770/m.168385 type:complete len:306 (+) Transcript_62770:2062-2979(+)
MLYLVLRQANNPNRTLRIKCCVRPPPILKRPELGPGSRVIRPVQVDDAGRNVPNVHLLKKVGGAVPGEGHEGGAPLAGGAVQLLLGVALAGSLGSPDLSGVRLTTLWVDLPVNLLKSVRILRFEPGFEIRGPHVHVGDAGVMTICQILKTEPIHDGLDIVHEHRCVPESIIESLIPLQHPVLLRSLRQDLRPRQEHPLASLVPQGARLQGLRLEPGVSRERIVHPGAVDRPYLRGDVGGLQVTAGVEGGVVLAAEGVKRVRAPHHRADAVGGAPGDFRLVGRVHTHDLPQDHVQYLGGQFRGHPI